jgi:hypothetical protein
MLTSYTVAWILIEYESPIRAIVAATRAREIRWLEKSGG